jgi:hypothetical protein
MTEPTKEELEKAKAATKGQGDERDKAGKTKEEGEERATVEKSEIVTEEDLLKAIDLLTEFTKAQEENEEEDEAEEKGDKEEEEEEEEKSYDDAEDSETLEKAIEVSPFLEALVNETSLALEAVGNDLGGLKKSMTEFDGKYIEHLKSLTEIVKGLHTEIKDFRKSTEDRLSQIESQPGGARKSIIKAVEIKKSFAGGGSEDSDFASLSKRTVAEALTKAVMDRKIPDTILMAYEAEHNYQLNPAEQEIVKSYLGK